jgi:hypothetical protein
MAPSNDFKDKQPKVSHKFDEQKQASFIEEYKKLCNSVSADGLFSTWIQCIPPKGVKCHLDGYAKG